MATVPIPVALWADYQGFYTAIPVEAELFDAAGFDSSAGGALSQVKSYLAWRCKEFGIKLEPDFLEPELLQARVSIRPQYQDASGKRSYPCQEAVELRIPCVRGRTESGILRCCLPTLRLAFTYFAIFEAPDLTFIQLSPSRALNWQWTMWTVVFLPSLGLMSFTASMVPMVVS